MPRLLGPEPRAKFVKRRERFVQRRPPVAYLQPPPANYSQNKLSPSALELHFQPVLQVERALRIGERTGHFFSDSKEINARQRAAAASAERRRVAPARSSEELEVLCSVLGPSKSDQRLDQAREEIAAHLARRS